MFRSVLNHDMWVCVCMCEQEMECATVLVVHVCSATSDEALNHAVEQVMLQLFYMPKVLIMHQNDLNWWTIDR